MSAPGPVTVSAPGPVTVSAPVSVTVSVTVSAPAPVPGPVPVTVSVGEGVLGDDDFHGGPVTAEDNTGVCCRGEAEHVDQGVGGDSCGAARVFGKCLRPCFLSLFHEAGSTAAR